VDSNVSEKLLVSTFRVVQEQKRKLIIYSATSQKIGVFSSIPVENSNLAFKI
jgi:hypothetical protein